MSHAKKGWDRVYLTLPPKLKEMLMKTCQRRGSTMTKYMERLVRADIEKEFKYGW